MAEIKITTKFVTTGKRPVITVRASDGRKGQYPASVSTTKTHEGAARKFATKIAGKSVALVKVEDGPQGDRFTVTVPETENVPESEPSEG